MELDYGLLIGLAIFLLIGIGLAALIWVGMKRVKKEAEAWQQVASRLGFEYIKEDKEFHTKYPFHLFLCGSPNRRFTWNILRGAIHGMKITVATFNFSSQSSSESATICLIENTGINFPEFSLVSLSSLNRKIFYNYAMEKGKILKKLPLEICYCFFAGIRKLNLIPINFRSLLALLYPSLNSLKIRMHNHNDR